MTGERLDTCVACLAEHAPQLKDADNSYVAEVATVTVIAHAVRHRLSVDDLVSQMCKTHALALAVGLRSFAETDKEPLQ
jgi:hypothetical protein